MNEEFYVEPMGGAGFILGFIFIMLLFYFVNAIALHKISNDVGYDKGWLAWIPVANNFVMPILVENDVDKSLRGKFTIIFAISFALGLFIPFVSLIMMVMSYYAFYIISKWYSEKYVAHLIVSIVTLGISMPFSLLAFANSNKTPKKEEKLDTESLEIKKL